MSLFDSFKKKLSTVSEKISTVTEQVTHATTTAISSVTESVKETINEALGFDRLKEGLSKTRETLVNRLAAVLLPGRKIDESLIADIEEILITADVGVKTTNRIIAALRTRIRKQGFDNVQQVYELIQEEIVTILGSSPSAHIDRTYSTDHTEAPFVLMVVGVNGVGKTTSIGKLAKNYKSAGKRVIIGAADTFRAAANEQLEVWAHRADVEIIMQGHGADPAAVAYDTLKAAKDQSADVVIIDTAGRLHNKIGLMAELEKLSRVMKKVKPTAPDEVFLVLDATTGQNAIQQAKEFAKVSPITGLILTKLDGTAKGGVVIAIAAELNIPVRYIGVGEKIDDLQPFDPMAFAVALFQDNALLPFAEPSPV